MPKPDQTPAGEAGSGSSTPQSSEQTEGADSQTRSAVASEMPLADRENAPASWLARMFRRNGAGNTRDDLSDALAQTTDSDLTPEEKQMLNNILRLQDVRVEDLMVPRAEIEAVEIDKTLAELLTIFEKSGHSRMPVYHETLDDPRGMIHIRDLVGYITRISTESGRTSRKGAQATNAGRSDTRGPSLDLAQVDLSKSLGKLSLIRKVLFVPPSMLATDLMERMQAMRIQMALVIDEYGGTEGIVSLEDIVEIIVGDIEDEHDDEDILIQQSEPGVLSLDARAEIDDINETLGGAFHAGEHEKDAHTIGGVIFSLLGRVPVKGEVVKGFGYEFRIKDADPRRIKTIEMLRSKKAGSRKAETRN